MKEVQTKSNSVDSAALGRKHSGHRQKFPKTEVVQNMSSLSQCVAHVFNKDKYLGSLGVEIHRQKRQRSQ
jgi:hypothetical protein